MTSFRDAMIPPHVQDELKRIVFPCPNEPPCEHSGLVHDINDWDDPVRYCCEDGCHCGSPSPVRETGKERRSDNA